MRNTTSRALRVTATVAGVAALGASIVGTASADTGLGGLGGSDNSYGDSGGSDFGGLSEGKSIMDEPGLANFEMPGIGMGSRGMRTSGPFDFGGDTFGGDDNHYSGGRRHHSSDYERYCDDDSDGYDGEGGTFQYPSQCKHSNYGEHNDFGLFGQNYRTAYKGKSIGSRSMRTDGDLFGGDSFGGSHSGGSSHGMQDFGYDNFYSHDERGIHSRSNGSDDDNGYGGSGHHFKFPISI